LTESPTCLDKPIQVRILCFYLNRRKVVTV
jgi:hypothetical protein